MQTIIKWVENKFHSLASHKSAIVVLFLIAFLEASLPIIPIELLLVPIIIVQKNKWFKISLKTGLMSVVGGLAGYFIGYLFFDQIGIHIISHFGLMDQFQILAYQYKTNAFWVIASGAFSIIPYPIFSLSAGFAQVPLLIFICASLVGRLLRFILVGYVFSRVGNFFDKKRALWLKIILVIFTILFMGILFYNFGVK